MEFSFLSLGGGGASEEDFLGGDVVGDEVTAEFGEGAIFDGGAGLFHRAHEHAGIVNAEQAEAEDFADVEEVADVGTSEILTSEAIAVFFDWPEVGFVCATFDADAAFAGEGSAVAGDAGRKYAIEHVDTAGDEFDHLGGRAQAHGIAGLVGGEMRFGDFNGAKHFRLGFADADAADGVAVEFESDEGFGAFFAELGIDAALDDAEDHLTRSAGLFAAFGGPAHGAFDGRTKFARRARVRRAIIEDHGDVGPEFALNLHGFFGTEKEERAIEMRAEFDAVGFDFANGGEAEDLEAAGVGEDWERPIDKFVEAAGGADDFHAGANVEVIGVAENDLSAEFTKFARIDGFDAALGADGHEDGGIDDAVGSGEATAAGAGGRVGF